MHGSSVALRFMNAVATRDVREVKIWLCDNGLVLNENKSEVIIMQSPNVCTQITMSRINILCGQLVDTSAVIRDLGFVMDDHLSMATQVSNICRSAYYHLSRIAKIRHSLTTSVCKSLTHGLVTSRLDYGNAMLFGIADRLLHRLQMVQRSAARVVMQIRRGDRQSMTTIGSYREYAIAIDGEAGDSLTYRSKRMCAQGT